MKHELTLNQFPTTKEGIKNYSDHFLMEVEQGNIDPLKAFVEIKAIQEYLKNIESNIKTPAKDTFEKGYQKGESVYYGASAVVKNLADKYDYTNDSTIVELEAEKKAIEEKIKARKELMNTVLKTKSTMYDEDGAEIKPPVMVKPGGSTLAITLAK
jgi:hypothetical protein